MVDTHCPQCGSNIHRSRSRGLSERFVKALTSYRTYRCPDCWWRGWLGAGDAVNRRRVMETLIGVLITLLITTLLALYLVRNLSSPD